MISTFMGLETSKRGMSVAQNALYTTGHNVANANTPGYSRQRVNLNPSLAFPSPGLNSPRVPGQLGTGVEAGSIQRIRDSFLDTQYREQNSKLGYYSSMSDSLAKMEEIMNDPTESGLLKTMNTFWNALEDLTVHTDNTAARAVVASTAEAVADTLNYYHSSLTNVQEDLRYQMGVKTDEINTLISNINDLNVQISRIEPNGLIPNDLYDERDVLVDKLSQLVNVKVTSVMPTEYGIADRAVAEGLYNIELIQEDGSLVNLINVTEADGIVDMKGVGVEEDTTTGQLKVIVGEIDKTTGKVTTGTPLSNFSGEFAALLESVGTTYPDMLKKLNNMTEAFVKEFNRVHSQGYALGATAPSNMDFFTIDPGKDAAASIEVNTKILENPSLIAAASQPGGAAGDNKNAHELAVIKSKSFQDYGDDDPNTAPPTDFLPTGLKDEKGSFDDYYAGIIGKLGVDSASAQKNKGNTQILVDSVDRNRQSVSAVSLDEEMTDMIKFQQAYNASARMITVIDELLDKLINGM
ncbi:flagellar hook-associated protein FlgK [Peribacillus asahii]|uniref:flagellar hook-associated protein FlgK n=1 Tax=Peribacillus asahii TaxID=228899 RepID=UPI00207A6CF1|nr:flagellar hook-associated protein FlgK [Peribacillus asahii]USK69978.1 flagellar hook-associated protein FlgK [Peribacillus asahii]